MINNASKKLLNATSSNDLPHVGAALIKWFQPMSFFVVTKTNVAYQVKETMVEVNFRGVWQPLSPREIYYKPEGQRAWKWFKCHAEPTLVLNEDDVVFKDDIQYRVKALWQWDEYGYREYHLVEDFTGKGPEEVTP